MPDEQTATETDETTETATEQTTADETTETDAADPRVKRANSEAAKYRTELRATEAKLAESSAAQQAMLDNIAKALGLKADADADPAAQVGALTTQVETLTSRTQQLEAELLVHTLAPDNGANPVALLDSRAFTDALAKIDASADNYRDAVAEAIKSAVETSPTFRAAAQVASAGGAETAGQGAGSGAVVTAEQFEAMGLAARSDLFKTNPALYRELAANIR